MSKTNSGLTIIEVVLVIALTGILLTGLLGLEQLIAASRRSIESNTLSYDSANVALRSLLKELRNARTAENGAYPLAQTDDQEIIFYANVDNDSQTERVHYWLDGDQIKRGVTQPTGDPPTYPAGNEQTSLIISDVQNQSQPIFYYYNGDWPTDTTNNPLPTGQRITQTKFIRVKVIINPTPSKSNTEFQLESGVQLRNLKTNL